MLVQCWICHTQEGVTQQLMCGGHIELLADHSPSMGSFIHEPPAFPMNGARGGEWEDASAHFRCNRGATCSPAPPMTHRGSGSSGWALVQASKQVGKKPPEGCSCESEVVTRNALEIGCNGKRWKRGGKRLISRLTTEWGLTGSHSIKFLPRGLQCPTKYPGIGLRAKLPGWNWKRRARW